MCVFLDTMCFGVLLKIQPRQFTRSFASKNKCTYDYQNTVETHGKPVYQEKVSTRK